MHEGSVGSVSVQDSSEIAFHSFATQDNWDTDYNSYNWEPEFMTIFVTWESRVTLDSIRNSCDVLTMQFVVQCFSIFNDAIFIGPRSPGPIYVSGCHKLSELRFWNFTDVTPADEDTNLILTDNDKNIARGTTDQGYWLHILNKSLS